MINFITKLYNNSPLFFQNIAISLYGYFWKKRRLGGIFKKECQNFKQRESYTKKQWKEYQKTELRKLLIHAFTNVPFYKEKYAKAGFNLEKFKTFEIEDLKKLPFLEKDELRKFGTTTLLSINKEKGKFISSSGSTGTPTKIYFSKKFHQKWSAVYETRVRNWANVNYKMRRGMIGGRRILPNANAKAPYYRYNFFEKQTYFSAYHISKKTTPNYVKGLIENKVEYLVGYAMSIYFLADFINRLNIKSPKLKAVLTSSEKITKQMRNTIEKAFQCKVFDGYSGVEACGLISENKFGELLFSPDTGIMEVIDTNGNDTKLGETGKVVATGLLNYDQPLIRYKIGDRVTLAKEQKTKSGIQMPIIKEIEGRIEDVIIGKDGRKMVRFHGLFINIPFLLSAQIIQHSLSAIEIKLVVESQFSKSEENIIKERLTTQLNDIKISFNYVNEIPKNNNGKYQAVISKLKK